MTTPAVGVLLPRDLPAEQILPFARRADDLGFDELWVVEDLGFRGGVAQAAAVLAATSRVHVGIGILPAAVRSVAFTAMEAATLAQLFPGRVTIGIGHGMPGWMRSVGVWPDRPLTYLGAYTRALRTLLRGGTVHDDVLGVHDVALEKSSLPDAVPDVVLGVRGPRSLAVSGQVADGTILAEPTTPQYVSGALAQIAAPGPHRVVAYGVAAVDDDEATALAAVRAGLAWIGEPDWAPHLVGLPFADDLAHLRARSSSREAFAAALPDAWVRELALVGTPAQVGARIAALGAAGASSVGLTPVGPDPLSAVEQLARVVGRV
ncbi:LLM class flavin-dependent oxidoreductase [Cellulomonas persica]|uniref:N5,N10-methylene tetrahydromethanopterin reductase n=1 Tax=Cellulomonas persica TaxID=76861 RepID=A0A510US56_9CELL|nr:LLM class flavin-dependent oxidoreductase [Cellulomonas persica]GEK17497.1 N5,N10-methylene tetrahydromethanopterin reductase [Cellulomonas persica]